MLSFLELVDYTSHTAHEPFTLSDLQTLVQTQSRSQVHKASFRRVLTELDAVTPMGKYVQQGRGRPAELYRRSRMTAQARAKVAYRLAQWRFA